MEKTTVILGVPLSSEVVKAIDEIEEFDLLDWDELGFEIVNDELDLGYCGVVLGEWYGEEHPYMVFKGGASSDCRIQPPGKREKRIDLVRRKQLEKKAREQIKKLDSRVKKACSEFGIYFITS